MNKPVILNSIIALLTVFTLNTAYASEEVVGGQVVSNQDLISQRTVGLFMKIGNGAAICSGEIIDSSHILAAAHCVTNFESGYVVFSTGDITTILKTNPSVARKITGAKAMPGYDGETGGSGEFADFSIITFSGGLESGYEPAHFLPQSILKTKLKVSTAITLAGYGITNPPTQSPGAGWQGAGILRKVNVKLAQIGGQKIDMYLQGQTGHIACEGDSGGPAMIAVSGDEYVIGVDSRGNCQDLAIYGIVSKEMVDSFVSSVSF